MRQPEQTPFALPASTSDGLNLVRGLSAQLVLFGHAISFLGIFPILQPPATPYLQNVGVVAFFFISGIVIAYTIETKTNSYQEFLFDRSTRIFTALVPALFFVAVVDRIFLGDPHYNLYAENSSAKTFIGNIALLAEYPGVKIGGHFLTLAPITVDRFGTLRPIWSVILECWLYVFFGYLFLSRTVRSRIAIVGCAILFVFSILPALAGFTNGKGSGLSYVWLLGAVYYRLVLRTDLLTGRLPTILFGLAVALAILAYGRPMMSVSEQGYDLRYSLAICFAIALSIEAYRLAKVPERIRSSTRIFAQFIASYSFSLYLVHYTILAPIPVWLDSAPRSLTEKLAALVIVLVVSNLLAYVFFLAFESRYRAVRQFLGRARSVRYRYADLARSESKSEKRD